MNYPKLLYWAALPILLVLLFACGLIMTWTLWPYRPMLINGKLEVKTAHIVSSGTVDYEFEYCKAGVYDRNEAQVYHIAVSGDESIYIFRITQRHLETGCHKGFMEVLLPPLKPGLHKLEMHRIYQPNPIRRVDVHAESEEFMVWAN